MSDLELKAQNASSVIPAAELHGMVCGLAAGAPGEFSLSDLVELAGIDALTDEQSVGEFVKESLDALYAEDLQFAPLLPDDAQALPARLSAIAEWSAAFLVGFAGAISVGEQTPVDALPPDVQEILSDFESISLLDIAVEGSEQDEGDYVELYEFLRVATVLTMTLMMGEGDGGAQGGE